MHDSDARVGATERRDDRVSFPLVKNMAKGGEIKKRGGCLSDDRRASTPLRRGAPPTPGLKAGVVVPRSLVERENVERGGGL